MKLKVLFTAAIALALTACGGTYVDPDADLAYTEGNDKSVEFCYIEGEAPQGNVDYTFLKNVKAAKGVYGSVTEVIPQLRAVTILRGGNAVVNYKASQRFGFWPWRFVRPVARGRAIQITDAHGLSCSEMGGRTLNELVGSDE